MLTLTTVLIILAVTVLVAVTTAVWWTQRRCECQREAPLASLRALRDVTARARREQAQGASAPGLGRPSIRGLRLTTRPPT